MNGHENENMTKSDFVSFKIFLFEAEKLKVLWYSFISEEKTCIVVAIVST